MFNSLWTHDLQDARLPCPSLPPRVCSNSCPLSQWCHPTISSSVAPSPPVLSLSQLRVFSKVCSSHQLMLQLQHQSFQWTFRVDFSWGLIGLIFLQSKWLSRVFSSTTIQKHQFFGTRPSLWPSSHIRPYMTTGKTTALIIWSEKDLRLTKKHLEQRDKQRLGCGSLNKELHRIYSPSVPMFTCKCATLSCQLFLFEVSIWD